MWFVTVCGSFALIFRTLKRGSIMILGTAKLTPMILDHLSRASLYFGLGSGIRTGLEFLSRPDLARLEGRYELPDSGGSYAIVEKEKLSRVAEGARWEAHRKMIDLHFLIHGEEWMGYADVCRLEMEQYHEEGDYSLGDGEGDRFLLRSGYFTIMFPEDAHQPSLAPDDQPSLIRRVVVKVPVASLSFA